MFSIYLIKLGVFKRERRRKKLSLAKASVLPPYTVGENIIATIKMRNNLCYPLKLVNFPILR